MTDFVLIHGSYQGGWIWKLVSERLRAKGHNVLAPTLDGCGERAWDRVFCPGCDWGLTAVTPPPPHLV